MILRNAHFCFRGFLGSPVLNHNQFLVVCRTDSRSHFEFFFCLSQDYFYSSKPISTCLYHLSYLWCITLFRLVFSEIAPPNCHSMSFLLSLIRFFAFLLYQNFYIFNSCQWLQALILKWRHFITIRKLRKCAEIWAYTIVERSFREIANVNTTWAFSALIFKSEYASFALRGADFDPLGRNRHPTRNRVGHTWLLCGSTVVSKMTHF